MNTLKIANEYALGRHHAIYNGCAEGNSAIFIWDDDYWQKKHYSRKRLLFIYECLLDCPVEIYHGSPHSIITALTEQHEIKTIEAAFSPDPLWQELIAQSIKGMDIDLKWHRPEPFVDLPLDTDMKRFFRYWNKAKKQLLV